MFSEPSGWLALMVAAGSFIVGIVQIWQGHKPRRPSGRTRVEHVRTLTILGISYTARRVETRDHHQP